MTVPANRPVTATILRTHLGPVSCRYTGLVPACEDNAVSHEFARRRQRRHRCWRRPVRDRYRRNSRLRGSRRDDRDAPERPLDSCRTCRGTTLNLRPHMQEISRNLTGSSAAEMTDTYYFFVVAKNLLVFNGGVRTAKPPSLHTPTKYDFFGYTLLSRWG